MTELITPIISTDKTKLDLNVIHRFLTQSYWGKGRTMEQVRKSIENTMCFGVYLNDEQIGFARVLSDQVVYAYLMDVFILEEYRGKGYASLMLNEILHHPSFIQVPKWFLATRDAHPLYKQFGFKEIADPKIYMERILERQNQI